MGLMRVAAVGAAGYAVYRYLTRGKPGEHAAFAPGESDGLSFANVRNAGPQGMRSDPPEWDSVDEASDESFPASDPPARH